MDDRYKDDRYKDNRYMTWSDLGQPVVSCLLFQS